MTIDTGNLFHHFHLPVEVVFVSQIQCELTSVSRLCRKSKAQLLPAGDEWSQSAVHQDVGLQHHPDHQRSAALSRREIRASASPVSDKSTNAQSSVKSHLEHKHLWV